MGHKVNPVAFRLGIQRDWKSRWFNKRNYREFLEDDFIIRSWLGERLANAAVESVDISRSGNSVLVIVRSARPGMVIGRGGKGLEELQRGLKKELERVHRRKDKFAHAIKLEIEEIRKPETAARLVASGVAEQLEKRMPFRRVIKQAVEKVSSESGVKGVRVVVSGRLGGAEIARREHLSRGKVPLQNLRADVDYAQAEAHTTYGVVGVKVWIYKGEVFEDKK